MTPDPAAPTPASDAPGWLRGLQGAVLGLLGTAALLQMGVGLPKLLATHTWWAVPLVSAVLMTGPRWARRAVWCLATLSAMLLAVVVFTPAVPRLYHAYVLEEAPQPADLIVVLSGSTYESRFTQSSQERFLYGVSLWRSGWAPKILFTGDPGDATNRFAEVAVATLRRLNLPVDDVLTLRPPPGVRASNTHGEALATAATVRGTGIRRILLVTSPSHTRRARLAFQRAGLSVVAAAVPSPGFRVREHVSRDVKLYMCRALVYEAEAMLVYRLRRWL